jgi:hypothetical protein
MRATCSISSAEDIRLLRLAALLEGAELAEMYARHTANYASVGDEEAIEYVLGNLVKSVRFIVATWRDMHPKSSALQEPTA